MPSPGALGHGADRLEFAKGNLNFKSEAKLSAVVCLAHRKRRGWKDWRPLRRAAVHRAVTIQCHALPFRKGAWLYEPSAPGQLGQGHGDFVPSLQLPGESETTSKYELCFINDGGGIKKMDRDESGNSRIVRLSRLWSRPLLPGEGAESPCSARPLKPVCPEMTTPQLPGSRPQVWLWSIISLTSREAHPSQGVCRSESPSLLLPSFLLGSQAPSSLSSAD